tara:strand:+ start:485 stop:715 length:231 start_codon:yes stop_codon:yes gene_type:complete
MASYEQVTYNGPDGAVMGKSASEKIGFYGTVPVVQRATASTHTTTAVVTSASYGTLQVAQMQEVMNTLAGLGLWAS